VLRCCLPGERRGDRPFSTASTLAVRGAT